MGHLKRPSPLTPDLNLRSQSMKSQEKRIDRLKQVLALLSRGETVQNRQLKTLLGVEHYARYLDDCREQEQVREMLGDKPKKSLNMKNVSKPRRSHTVKRTVKVQEVGPKQ